MKQIELAKELGISKSYLSMILSGQRKPSPELADKLQSIPGVHKVVNNYLWHSLCTEEVRGSNPLSSICKTDYESSRKSRTQLVGRFASCRPQGISKRMMEASHYTVHAFTGHPVTVEGIDTHLSSLECKNRTSEFLFMPQDTVLVVMAERQCLWKSR
jgi:transcriptional regulator with XRE-family HTH domain